VCADGGLLLSWQRGLAPPAAAVCHAPLSAGTAHDGARDGRCACAARGFCLAARSGSCRSSGCSAGLEIRFSPRGRCQRQRWNCWWLPSSPALVMRSWATAAIELSIDPRRVVPNCRTLQVGLGEMAQASWCVDDRTALMSRSLRHVYSERSDLGWLTIRHRWLYCGPLPVSCWAARCRPAVGVRDRWAKPVGQARRRRQALWRGGLGAGLMGLEASPLPTAAPRSSGRPPATPRWRDWLCWPSPVEWQASPGGLMYGSGRRQAVAGPLVTPVTGHRLRAWMGCESSPHRAPE